MIVEVFYWLFYSFFFILIFTILKEFIQSIRPNFALKLEKKCLNKVCKNARQTAWLNDSNLIFNIDGKEYKYISNLKNKKPLNVLFV